MIYGLELKQAWAQREKALNWLNRNDQVTPVADDYLAAASIQATARRQGTTLELPDCRIAAMAVRLGLPLLTGNTADFVAIQQTGVGLIIRNWREP